MLKSRRCHGAQAAKALRGVAVQRITFTEVTSKAVQDALAAPRTISQALVDAYLARRALDYLFGFTLSPLLWRKLPGSRSAGLTLSFHDKASGRHRNCMLC